MKELLISAGDRETRVAVLEDGRVTEVQIERRRQRGVVGNIYKGRVTRVLPGMQSAFVDLGLEKDAFLYVADVGEEVDDFDRFGAAEEEPEPLKSLPEPTVATASTSRERGGRGGSPKAPLPSIDELLREGQEVVVQVTKDMIAHKGVRITTHVTLPGRTLVYMPTIDHVGVSRRIENEEERNRLKEILTGLKKGPGGYIVRTAGEGRSAEEFSSDRRYLTKLWEQIRKKAERTGAPAAPPPRPRPRAPRRARHLRPGLRDALGRRRRGVPARRGVPRPGPARARPEGQALPGSRRPSSRSTASRPRSRTP